MFKKNMLQLMGALAAVAMSTPSLPAADAEGRPMRRNGSYTKPKKRSRRQRKRIRVMVKASRKRNRR
jgi:hypothetical protein